jgi:acyl-CoA synthetase (NDP forming)
MLPGTGLSRPSLHRVLDPKTVAIVGVSEQSQFVEGVRRTLESDAEVYFVHPKRPVVFGRATYPDLRAVGHPVDAVLSMVGAEGTVRTVEEAADTGAGGVITIAGGFAEVGPSGAELQARMLAAATRGGFPVIGPNGVGMINVPRKLDLCILRSFKRRPGGLSAVTHSGAMIGAIAAAGWRPGGVGLNLLISAGNEAVTDVADYLNYLVDDPGTKVIALALEKIRRPAAFFDAARRALEAGKPIFAIKMSRTERSQRLAASHTGTLTGESWVYEVAFRQAGIQSAYDIDDLVDRVQFLEQLPRSRWSPVRGLAVLTATGGFAQLASDLCEEEDVPVPEVPRLQEFLTAKVPGGTVTNPLDATGFVIATKGLWEGIVREFASAPEFDALLFIHQHADWDIGSRRLADGFVETAKDSGKPVVIGPLAGIAGQWLEEFRAAEVAVGNGLRGCLRGLHAMGAYMRTRQDSQVQDPASVASLPRPTSLLVTVPEGAMLGFATTMTMLAGAGIPVAEYSLIDADDAVSKPPFPGPYVVKLADVAHRTEHGAVRVNVPAQHLHKTVDDLRALAAAEALPALVAVQPMIAGHGEAFIGIRGESELGPAVAFGLGGIFVEMLHRIGGRLAPLSSADATELIHEFRDTGVIDGFRGAPPWDTHALARVLVAAGQLAAGGRGWIQSIDINPLIISPTGPIAVDGLCLLRPDRP